VTHQFSAWFPVLLVPLLFGIFPAASAQEEPLPVAREAAEPRTFGTSSTTSHTLQAFAFTGFSPSEAVSLQANRFGSRFCTIPCAVEAPLFLPAGALVTAIELDACDTSAPTSVTVGLFRVGRLESSVLILASGVTTGTGCQAVMTNLPTPHTIDNANFSYFVQVFLGGNTDATRFQAVRVHYTLQVSPAPAVATFPNDVPTGHPLFQFIEALALAGVTAGCGPGSFCPDSPVTRGQMAVFLSKALGLHFAP
jgi:hypothetical protein